MTKRSVDPSTKPRGTGKAPATPQGQSAPDDEGRLKNLAGQAWDTERLDRLRDEDVDQLELDQAVREQSGEMKGRRKKGPHGRP